MMPFILCFWNKELEGNNNILDVHYEELVKNTEMYQKKIYRQQGDDKNQQSFFKSILNKRC